MNKIKELEVEFISENSMDIFNNYISECKREILKKEKENLINLFNSIINLINFLKEKKKDSLDINVIENQQSSLFIVQRSIINHFFSSNSLLTIEEGEKFLLSIKNILDNFEIGGVESNWLWSHFSIIINKFIYPEHLLSAISNYFPIFKSKNSLKIDEKIEFILFLYDKILRTKTSSHIFSSSKLYDISAFWNIFKIYDIFEELQSIENYTFKKSVDIKKAKEFIISNFSEQEIMNYINSSISLKDYQILFPVIISILSIKREEILFKIFKTNQIYNIFLNFYHIFTSDHEKILTTQFHHKISIFFHNFYILARDEKINNLILNLWFPKNDEPCLIIFNKGNYRLKFIPFLCFYYSMVHSVRNLKPLDFDFFFLNIVKLLMINLNNLNLLILNDKEWEEMYFIYVFFHKMIFNGFKTISHIEGKDNIFDKIIMNVFNKFGIYSIEMLITINLIPLCNLSNLSLSTIKPLLNWIRTLSGDFFKFLKNPEKKGTEKFIYWIFSDFLINQDLKLEIEDSKIENIITNEGFISNLKDLNTIERLTLFQNIIIFERSFRKKHDIVEFILKNMNYITGKRNDFNGLATIITLQIVSENLEDFVLDSQDNLNNFLDIINNGLDYSKSEKLYYIIIEEIIKKLKLLKKESDIIKLISKIKLNHIESFINYMENKIKKNQIEKKLESYAIEIGVNLKIAYEKTNIFENIINIINSREDPIRTAQNLIKILKENPNL